MLNVLKILFFCSITWNLSRNENIDSYNFSSNTFSRVKILKNLLLSCSYLQDIIPSPQPFTKLYKFFNPGFGFPKAFLYCLFSLCS